MPTIRDTSIESCVEIVHMIYHSISVGQIDLHNFIVAYNFDCHIRIAACLIASTDHITEHTLTCKTGHNITIV